jgi:hypothetical protein
MSPTRRLVVTAAAALAILAGPHPGHADEPQPTSQALDFFEKKVRPLLAEHCSRCHGREGKVKGGLRLDNRAGLLKGGESGPALVPGKPDESLLIKAVRYADPDLRMPPKGKLAAAAVADLERWVALGAPMPKDTVARAPAGIDFAAARRHWAYQPVRKPSLPAVKDRAWAAAPLDFFILARLEEKGLTPSAPADRRTLLRRVSFDLIGLPPTAAEIEAFEQDTSPEAYEKVVDRLLASPRHGERWARHWLDVARYADTKDGVLMYGFDRIRPYAYTYRDYVIRALNEDTPFDRFVHEQLAADQIEPKVEPWRLGAMGFLTLGRMFDNNVHDVLDDRIDTVTRGLLGLTVACARCHDHKYDAIPTTDYYSLYGVFASSEAPLELPLTERPESLPGAAEFEKSVAPKRAALRKFLDDQYALLSETARQRVGDYLVHVATKPPDPLETAIYFLSLAPEDLRPPIINRWRRYLERHARADDPVLGPWYDLMKLPEVEFAGRAQAVLDGWKARPEGAGKGQVNPLVRDALAGAKLTGKADVARAYGDLLRRVYHEGKKRPVVDTAVRQQVLDLVTGRDSPAHFPRGHTWQYMSRGEKDAFGGKRTELDRLAAQAPAAPPRAMVLRDAEILEPRVFVRGNPGVFGEKVPRQFLRVLAGDDRKPFPHGSGRLDLAKAITAPDNPLTARVLVNRVWMHHFGEPLVATPSDFGARSSPPTHPELLDYLAATFVEDGWSLKRLHRRIVLSAAYRQASWDRPECRKADPENRLLWRANRRRLDLEAMRDALLFVSGRLDAKLYGRPVDVAGDAGNRRRTVYGLVDRQSLPGLFRAFDFASPDTSAERRPFTTVPQQALFALNAPFMLEQAKGLAAGAASAGAGPEPRIRALYRRALAREASGDELSAAVRFVNGSLGRGQSPQRALEDLAQVVLMTNEFTFVD